MDRKRKEMLTAMASSIGNHAFESIFECMKEAENFRPIDVPPITKEEERVFFATIKKTILARMEGW